MLNESDDRHQHHHFGCPQPLGFSARAFMKASLPPYDPVVCDYIVDELHRKFQEKFPKRITELEAFLFHALQVIRVVPTPKEETSGESTIRDVKDRPILRAARHARVDMLLTGDRDFLESGIDNPMIVSAADFLMNM